MRQMWPEIAPIPPATMIRKKRVVLDDFGARGNLPDDKDIENKKP